MHHGPHHIPSGSSCRAGADVSIFLLGLWLDGVLPQQVPLHDDGPAGLPGQQERAAQPGRGVLVEEGFRLEGSPTCVAGLQACQLLRSHAELE
jgi:hypothetical protein